MEEMYWYLRQADANINKVSGDCYFLRLFPAKSGNAGAVIYLDKYTETLYYVSERTYEKMFDNEKDAVAFFLKKTKEALDSGKYTM